jgi:hypothetical protein
MKTLIKKILKEQSESNKEKFIRYVASKLKPPYFQNLNDIGVEENEIKPILSLIFNQPILKKNNYIYDKKGNQLYYERFYDRYWEKLEYDTRGNHIYTKNSDGYWKKKEYDERGNLISTYYKYSDGSWEKYEYDKMDNLIYFENYRGDWIKSEYNEIGELIYQENSDGEIFLGRK